MALNEMAVARCEKCGPPKRTTRSYSHCHELDLPSERIIMCGATGCFQPAIVWLTDEEEAQFRDGKREFRVLRHLTVRVR